MSIVLVDDEGTVLGTVPVPDGERVTTDEAIAMVSSTDRSDVS